MLPHTFIDRSPGALFYSPHGYTETFRLWFFFPWPLRLLGVLVGTKDGVAASSSEEADGVEAFGSEPPVTTEVEALVLILLEAFSVANSTRTSRRACIRASLSTSLEGRMSFAVDKVSSLPLLRKAFTFSRPFILGVMHRLCM